MLFLEHLSALAGRLTEREFYRQVSAWIIALALHARNGRYQPPPTLSSTPAQDRPSRPNPHNDRADVPYVVAEDSSYTPPDDATYYTFDRPARYHDADTLATNANASQPLNSTCTDLIWIGDVPPPSLPLPDLFPVIALLLLLGVLVGATMEVASALHEMRYSRRSSRLTTPPSLRDTSFLVFLAFYVLYLFTQPVYNLYIDGAVVSVYHLLLAIVQDDLAVPLRTIPYLAREVYKASKLVLSCLWRPDLITIRVAMGDSCYMLFAIPSCAFTYVDEQHQAYLNRIMDICDFSPKTNSLNCSTSSTRTERPFIVTPSKMNQVVTAVEDSYFFVDEGVSTFERPVSPAESTLADSAAQTDGEDNLCSACQRVMSHVHQADESSVSDTSMDIVAQNHAFPQFPPESTTYAARRAAIPAKQGLPRDLVPDCAEDELIFTDVAELRIYRAGFAAASDAAAHIPPAHHKIPDVPRKYTYAQRERDVFCFGWWEFQYLRDLTDLGKPLSSEYYLGMMAKEKDLVMMPGTRPYQETRAWRLGWCDDWYLTTHPMRNGQRSCRSWT